MAVDTDTKLAKTAKDLTGVRFGWLVVTGFSHRVRKVPARRGTRLYWLCECDCGRQSVVDGGHLRAGKTVSCGCRQGIVKHGQSGCHEYKVWMQMRDRCERENSKYWKNYGGRGIFVCERWKDFCCFISDMGRRPSKKHSLERVNNNGPYSPENCKWATRMEQSRNMRSNVWIDCFGKKICLKDFADMVGVTTSCIKKRLNRGLTCDTGLMDPADARYVRGARCQQHQF